MAVSQAQSSEAPSPEHQRLAESDHGHKPWKRWGPYLSERQWGTVREDDSPDGNAWNPLVTIRHDPAPTNGEKMVWQGSAMTASCFASP